MTTFHTRILQCPQCMSRMSTYELTSYTVHSSVVYSDGKVECNPPRMLDKRILICSDCNNEFWRDDAIIKGENLDITHDELPQAMDFHDLPFAFDSNYSFKLAIYFSDLLERGFANTIEREVFLRIELWHLINNSNRSDSKRFFKKSNDGTANDPDKENNLFKSNLSRLIDIYEPENNDQQLMRAEMYRELGDFSKALLILNEIKNVSNKAAYKKINSATKKKNPKVIKLN